MNLLNKLIKEFLCISAWICNIFQDESICDGRRCRLEGICGSFVPLLSLCSSRGRNCLRLLCENPFMENFIKINSIPHEQTKVDSSHPRNTRFSCFVFSFIWWKKFAFETRREALLEAFLAPNFTSNKIPRWICEMDWVCH